ncbi:hypothetical protein GCM10018954_055440 [Kutzneria kofuensis]
MTSYYGGSAGLWPLDTEAGGVRAPQVGTPASMRELNQRIVLDRLRRGGAATRPSLARDTGLSKPTVGQALLDLEQDGLVRPAGRTSAGPGRSAVLYEADPAAGHVLGIDIGRGRLRLAVADLAGTVVAKVDEPNRCRSASALVRTVQDMATGVVGQAGMALSDVVLTVVGSPACRTAAAACCTSRRTCPAGAVAACWTSWRRCSARTCWWRTTPTWPRWVSGTRARRAASTSSSA